jgi:hypothetical protein
LEKPNKVNAENYTNIVAQDLAFGFDSNNF